MNVTHHIKKLAGESFIYGLSGIISRFVSVFLFPFFTRVLTPVDYGTISILNSLYFVINVIAILGLNSAAFRWFYNTDRLDEQKSSIASWFWCELFVSGFMALLLIMFNDQLEMLFFNKISGYNYFYYLGMALVLNVIPSVAINYYRIKRLPVYSITFSITSTVVNVIANLFLVIYLKMGVMGMLVAQIISSAVGSIAGVLSFGNWLLPSWFSINLLKQMLKYGIPLILPNLSATFTVLFTNSIIQKYNGTGDVGFYQVAVTIASGISLLTAAFAQAWSPFTFSIMKQPDSQNVFKMVFRLYFILFTFLALAISLFTREIILLLATPLYLPSLFVAGILCFANLLNSLSALAFTGLSIVKKTGGYSIVTVISSGLTITMLTFMVPTFGKTGAAISVLLCQAITPLYLFYQSEKSFPIKFPFKFGALSIISSLALFFGVSSIQIESVMLSIFIKLFAIVFYTFILFYFNKSLLKKLQTALFKPKTNLS
jgi:O-antigen/teichoic acid export membrane protein